MIVIWLEISVYFSAYGLLIYMDKTDQDYIGAFVYRNEPIYQNRH